MTASTTELARAGFDALGEGGVEAMLEFVHPEFEMETLPGVAAEPQVYRGHGGVRRWFDSCAWSSSCRALRIRTRRIERPDVPNRSDAAAIPSG